MATKDYATITINCNDLGFLIRSVCTMRDKARYHEDVNIVAAYSAILSQLEQASITVPLNESTLF